MARKLTELQRRFADRFLVCLDAQKAYIEAGGAARYAKQNAYHMAQNKQVQKYLELRRAEISAAVGLDQKRVVEELKAVLDTDLADIMPWDDSTGLIAADKLTPAMRKAIKKIKIKRTTYEDKDGRKVTEVTTEVEMNDRLRAAELAGKANGLFREDQKPKEDAVFVVVMPPQAKDAAEWVKTYNVDKS